jgi:hypothetical protein
MVTAERSGSSLSSALVRDNSVCRIASVRAARKVFRELIYAQVGYNPTVTVNIARPCTTIWIAGTPRSLVIALALASTTPHVPRSGLAHVPKTAT